MRRFVLPLLLCAAGAWLLVGCFYLPAADAPAAPNLPNPYELVGPAGSDKPIRPGVARAVAIRLLGRPSYGSPDGNTLFYGFSMKAGYWVVPLCFSIDHTDRVVALRLVFDTDDRLSGYEFQKGEPRPPPMGMSVVTPHPPMLREAERMHFRSERNRPATEPSRPAP